MLLPSKGFPSCPPPLLDASPALAASSWECWGKAEDPSPWFQCTCGAEHCDPACSLRSDAGVLLPTFGRCPLERCLGGPSSAPSLLPVLWLPLSGMTSPAWLSLALTCTDSQDTTCSSVGLSVGHERSPVLQPAPACGDPGPGH